MKIPFVLFLFFALLAQQGLFANAKENTTPPHREVSIIVNEWGYYPDTISVYEGEKVRIYLTSAQENVMACFSLPKSFQAPFMTAKFGEITQEEYEFSSPGTWTFQCPGLSFRGKILVLSKSGKREKKRNQEDIKQWVPTQSLLE